jgi:hypothetical protein
VKVNSNVIVAAIGKSASPWLTVSKADGEVPSNKVASAETACIGRQLLADWQKVMFVVYFTVPHLSLQTLCVHRESARSPHGIHRLGQIVNKKNKNIVCMDYD